MKGSVESLNVAVTAGVLLYEAARQRSFCVIFAYAAFRVTFVDSP